MYGLTRPEALELPHWEFHQLVDSYSKQQARDTLSLYQAVGMAFGGKPKDSRQYVETLRKASGQKDRDREDKKKTKNPGSIFAGLSGLGTVDNYLSDLAGETGL